MFRYPIADVSRPCRRTDLRDPRPCVSRRRRSWGFVPFAVLLPSAGGLALPSAPSRLPFPSRAAPIIFVGGSAGPNLFPSVKWVATDHGAPARLPGFNLVGNPFPIPMGAAKGPTLQRAVRTGSGSSIHRPRPRLPWDLPLAGLWTPVGALARARPRVGRRPPETASGPYPLVGFAVPGAIPAAPGIGLDVTAGADPSAC